MGKTLYELSAEMKCLNKEWKFRESLAFFKEHKVGLDPSQIWKDGFVLTEIFKALRGSKNTRHLDYFVQTYGVEISANTNEFVLTAYGWALYDCFKEEHPLDGALETESNSPDEDEEEWRDGEVPDDYEPSWSLQAVRKLLPILTGKLNSEYVKTLFTNLFGIVTKTEMKKGAWNWKLINEICDSINPELLSTKCETGTVLRKGRETQTEFASDREKWYSMKSKALMKLWRFEECAEISKRALESFEKFHYSNDTWFSRRITLANIQLGKADSAIADMEAIYRKKREWYVEKDLAELYFHRKEYARAVEFCMRALANFGDLEHKVGVLELVGDALKLSWEKPLALKHFFLARLLRVREGWKVSPKLEEMAKELRTELPTLPQERDLVSELRPVWKSRSGEREAPFRPQRRNEAGSQTEKTFGTVSKILNRNEKWVNGFVESDDGVTAYFNLREEGETIQNLHEGSKVSYVYLPPKESARWTAVKIRVIPDGAY